MVYVSYFLCYNINVKNNKRGNYYESDHNRVENKKRYNIVYESRKEV